MAKLATRKPKAKIAKSPVRTTKAQKPDASTYNGGEGYSRDPKGELFMLAVTNMVGESTFYESAKDRDNRFKKLVHAVAVEDPDWLARFVPYLRNTMNMRSASVVLAAEAVHAKLTRPVPASGVRNRDVVSAALMRADEPAEMLGYWMSEYGKAIPKPVKRGVADAVQRLYSERSAIKNDGGDRPIRFGDVLELTHPEAKAPWQAALYKHLIDDRHGHAAEVLPEQLSLLAANRRAMALDQESFRHAFSPSFVEDHGMTWEQASSRYGALDKAFWESMIPTMGVFALVRNLRNFDDAQIGEHARDLVAAQLSDPEVIGRSRMFPLRFATAFGELASLTWGPALEAAINHATASIPLLKGKTLILVDMSGSMDSAISDKSTVKRTLPASVFGAAIATRAMNGFESPTLVAYSDTSAVIPVRAGQSVLLTAKHLVEAIHHGGTQTWQTAARLFDGHDRVVIVTDEQADYGFAYYSDQFGGKPVYTFNVVGYRVAHAPSGGKKQNFHSFGGLTDAGFTMIDLLERGEDQSWPF